MNDPSAADDWSTPSYGGSGTRTGGTDGGGRSGASIDSDWSETRTRGRPEQPHRQQPAQRRAAQPRETDDPGRQPSGERGRTGDRNRAGQRPVGRAYDDRGRPRNPPTSQLPAATDDWAPAGPVSSRQQRATRAADRQAERAANPRDAGGRPGEYDGRQPGARAAVDRRAGVPERGAAWWMALGVLIAITLVGALIDSVGSFTGQDAFNVGIVIGSLVAVLMVRRSDVFWIMVAPPLVYAVIAVVRVYVKSSTAGKHGATSAIIGTVQDYLTFGFLALAIATGAVVVIGGFRLLARK